MYDLGDNSTEEAYPHIKSNNATSRNIPSTTYYTWYGYGLLLGCTVHDRVVNEHKMLNSHALAVQRSLIVLRPSQAFHH